MTLNVTDAGLFPASTAITGFDLTSLEGLGVDTDGIGATSSATYCVEFELNNPRENGDEWYVVDQSGSRYAASTTCS